MKHLLERTPIKPYDRVTDGVHTYSVAKVLVEEWIPASERECKEAGVDKGWHLDLEFVDPEGKYHHYISWADGGGVLHHDVTIGYLVDWQKVRSLCIRRNWYTMGNSREYDHMLLEMIPDGIAYIDDIIDVAMDIYNHSDTQRFKDEAGYDAHETIEMIASLIINDCSWSRVSL